MTQKYTHPVAIERMAAGKCPECGAPVDDLTGWGRAPAPSPRWPVPQRIHHYRTEEELKELARAFTDSAPPPMFADSTSSPWT